MGQTLNGSLIQTIPDMDAHDNAERGIGMECYEHNGMIIATSRAELKEWIMQNMSGVVADYGREMMEPIRLCTASITATDALALLTPSERDRELRYWLDSFILRDDRIRDSVLEIMGVYPCAAPTDCGMNRARAMYPEYTAEQAVRRFR